MNGHLSSSQFVDALDGVLESREQRHLEACARCQHDLAELGKVRGGVRASAEAAEPSPLFWELLSERVRAATATEPVPARAVNWRRLWPVAIAASMLSLVAVGAVVRVVRVPPPSSARVAAVTAPGREAAPATSSAASQDQPWNLMVVMASNLPADELHQMSAPMPGAADAVAEDLSPAQQRELIKLLKAEVGGSE